MKDSSIKEAFIERRAQGWSFDRIAGELNVSKQTLIDWSREFEIEISNLRAIELEALQEKYFLTKQKRLELFGIRLDAITKELDKRDFNNVSTEKLLEIFLKYNTALRTELVEIRFSKNIPIFEKDDGFTSVKTWRG